MWKLVLTGTTLSIASQFVTGKGISTSSTQFLALAKYASLMVATLLSHAHSSQQQRQQKEHPVAKRASLLVTAIGILDVAAYAFQCIGLQLCGAALAVTIFAATSQSTTALLTRLVLGRKLSAQQLAAVVLVNAGLLIRALAPNTSKAGTAGVFGATSHRHLLGGGAILAASIGYSLMGVLYDMLMRLDGAPPYSEITNKTAKIGLGACLLYQIAFVAPRWSSLVTEVLAAHHVTLQFAALALAGVGAVFSMHNYWQAEVIRAQGAVALGIANAIRGALVTFLAGMFFCTPDAPWQCSTGWTHLSALVVTVGAVLWASARKSRHPQRSTQEPALDKQSSKSL